MPHILLTGGSGFIAAHVLEHCLAQGHTLVTTVRTQDKADKIRAAYPQYSSNNNKLSFAIVPDIAQEHAFDAAVQTSPPLDLVIHTASPFHMHPTDIQKDLLDPAVIGTTGLLKSVHAYAPAVKRVVITSSFAAINDPGKGLAKGYVYSESDWAPISEAQAHTSPSLGYRASKTFAERAAWDFVQKMAPNFTIATVNPPLVFGPIVHHLASLEALNTSNQRVRDMLMGKMREEIGETGTYLYVDVRDLAEAHVRAATMAEAENKRFFVVAGRFSNKMVAEVLRKEFGGDGKHGPLLPKVDAKGGDFPKGDPEEVMGFDNSRTREVLKLSYRPWEETIGDLARSLIEQGA